MRAPSLRLRLVAVAVALVAFAVAATAAATYVALRSYLNSQLNQRVLDLADDHGAPVCLSDRPGGPADELRAADLAVHLLPLTADGRPAPCLPGRAGGKPLPLSTEAVAGLLGDVAATGGLAEPRTVTGTDGNDYRAVVSTRRGVPVVLALPTAEVSSTLGTLLGLELIAVAVAVAGTAALGTVGVRLGLRPLDRITRTARTVAAELGPDGTGLERRVPGGDPDTEVGQLAEAVNTMLGAVEREYSARWESEQRMRRFLADASHELRTPLTSLRGYAELIRLRGAAGFDSESRDSLRRIESEGTRMARLVDDLLTLARHDRGVAPDRSAVDLAEVVADAAAGLRVAAPDRAVTVEAAGPLVVSGDRDQLLQVVGNLLTNAATHTRPGGPVTVTAAQRDGSVLVAVADAGPGLRPDQVDRVFDRFWRADAARTRTRGGSGLGLSIVQALVTAHGGQVAFESDPAAGTTVTVRLPAAR